MYYNTYKFEVSNDEDDKDDRYADPKRYTCRKVSNIIFTYIYSIRLKLKYYCAYFL
jgi:hypothetical protein